MLNEENNWFSQSFGWTSQEKRLIDNQLHDLFFTHLQVVFENIQSFFVEQIKVTMNKIGGFGKYFLRLFLK